jgi:DNA-binding IclR family transcriptional regulator
MKDDTQASGSGSQAIGRALDLISMVASNGSDGSRLSDLSKASGLHVATARRILQALVADGFLAFDTKSKVYVIGPAIFSIAVRSSPWYSRREVFMPVLERLAQRTHDTALFSVRSGSEAVCLARCEGQYPIRVMSLVAGSRRPLGVGSGSLAILSFLPESELSGVIEHNAEAYAHYNWVPDTLFELVAETKQRGYAFNPGKLLDNVYGVAVPILVDGVAVASFSVTAIADRLTPDRRDEIIETIQEELRGFGDITLPPIGKTV